MIKKILIVDDEAAILKVIKKRLELAGYFVDVAANGKEGLDIIKRGQAHDLVITDVVMPVMDGVDFYKELKRDKTTSKVPIIIITDSQVFKESFKALGVEGFLPKPLNARKLLDKIKQIFSLEATTSGRDKRILIAGSDENVLSQMFDLLDDTGNDVCKVDDAIDFLSSALMVVPRIALIDVLLKDVSAREIIKAMKCFIRFKDVNILTYTHFSAEELGDVNAVEQLKEAKNACTEAGATKYIGRFTRATFMDNLRPYLG